MQGAPGSSGADLTDCGRVGGINFGSGGKGGNGGKGGPGGGGGGGGYFGGGGAGGGGRVANPDLPDYSGAGGGGGSGYAAPAVTDATLLPGVNHGSGKVVVSFRYGTSISLTANPPTPLFGHPVTLTATVNSANPTAGTPGGAVTFSDGTTPLATMPLNGGKASFSTAKFQPGAHPITASYSGDPSFSPSATAGPTNVTVGFSQPCITTTRNGPLTVASGQSLCVGPSGKQQGPVTVQPGGALAVTGGGVTGPVSSNGALAISLCQSTFTGPVSVQETSGYTLLGWNAPTLGTCAGNTIKGPITLNSNLGGLEASANTITGPGLLVAPPQSGPQHGADDRADDGVWCTLISRSSSWQLLPRCRLSQPVQIGHCPLGTAAQRAAADPALSVVPVVLREHDEHGECLRGPGPQVHRQPADELQFGIHQTVQEIGLEPRGPATAHDSQVVPRTQRPSRLPEEFARMHCQHAPPYLVLPPPPASLRCHNHRPAGSRR